MSRRFALLLLCACAAAATVGFARQTAAPTLTGTWTGTFKPADSSPAESAHLVLKHSGKEVTGTAGPGPEEQWKIAKGVVAQTAEGTALTFDVAPANEGDVVIHFELKLVDGHLKGTAIAEQNGRKLTAAVDVTRAK
jgi:hypothetical protein